MKTLSFVIPVYNEEFRLDKTFSALQNLKLPSSLKLKEVIFVDDGSTDKTVSRIEYFVSRINRNPKILNTKYQIRIVSYPNNRGKGFAIRKGMYVSSADYTLFFDADMSTPLSQIEKLVPFMEKEVDVIVGTRKNGKSTVLQHQPFIREKLGQAFTLLTQIFLNLNTTDFTCGFKAFSGRAKNAIFAECKVNRWGYDAELIFLANRLGFSISEKAVIWSNDPKTKVRMLSAIPQTLSDLVFIRYNHELKGILLQYLKPATSGIIYRGVSKTLSVFL